jgi:hypothetical protein
VVSKNPCSATHAQSHTVRVCLRHFAARLLCRAAKPDTTQPIVFEALASPKDALPSRIVKEHSLQRW